MKVVEIYDDEPRMGTSLIADGLGRLHKNILQTVNDYEKDMKDFGVLKTRKLSSTGGRSVNEIMLNEDQFMFLGTLLRNSKKVVQFKKAIIKQFKKCRDKLESIDKERQNPKYIESREAGKVVRKETTDVMSEFVIYATNQGSKNANLYYVSITRMLNAMLFIVEGKYKNLRSVMTIQQLMTTSTAEHIVKRGLSDGMAKKKYYKEIYKDVKSRVKTFAELHGKSEIIKDVKLIE